MLPKQTLRNLIHPTATKIKSLMEHGFPVVSSKKCSSVFVLPDDFVTLAAEPFVKENTAILLGGGLLSACSATDRQRAIDKDLSCEGPKKSQQEDIAAALARWQDYKSRKGTQR